MKKLKGRSKCHSRLLKRFTTFFLTLSFGFVVSACSKLSIAVKWADTAIIEMTDSRFDFNSEQKKAFKAEVEQSIAKIKKEKFPIWADQFEAWANTIEKSKVSVETSDQMFNWLQSEFASLAKYAEAPMNSLIDKIDEANFEKNKKNSFDEITEQRKKIADQDDRIQSEKKKYLLWIEFWLDNQTDDQEKKLLAHINAHPFPAELAFKHREAQIQKFYDLRKDKVALKDWVKQTLYKPDNLRSAEFQAAFLAWQENLKIYIREFQLSLSDKQLKYLVQQLRKKAIELRELSQE